MSYRSDTARRCSIEGPLAWLLGDFRTSGVYTFYSGIPYQVNAGSALANSIHAYGAATNVPNVIGKPHAVGKVDCWFYTSQNQACRTDEPNFTDSYSLPSPGSIGNLGRLQPYFDKLLLMPGREVTTFQGHANVFGTTAFIDFRLTSPHVPTVNKLLQQVQDLHGVISLNHPGSPSGAACMGCGWTAPDTDFSRVNAIEAINGGSLDGPRSGDRSSARLTRPQLAKAETPQ